MIDETNIVRKKKCLECGTEMDYDEWVKSFKSTRPEKLAPLWWNNKKFCGKACCSRYRERDKKNCLHCGQVFNRQGYIANSNWKKRKFCSRKCSLEYGWIVRLANVMGLEYDVLKNELLKIVEKYSNG